LAHINARFEWFALHYACYETASEGITIVPKVNGAFESRA
jgi:hypothetical protein